MGVLPSTQPAATLGSSFILSSFDTWPLECAALLDPLRQFSSVMSSIITFKVQLMWLARVVYLLVGVAEGCGGWRGHAYPCAVTGHAMLRCSVGVGAGFLRGVLRQKDEKASNFIWGARWGVGVGGGLVGVGLGSLRFAGGVNVASK